MTNTEQLIKNLHYAIAQLGGYGCSASKGYVQDAVTLITDLLAEVDRLHSLTEGDPNTIYHEAAQLRAERDAAVARADTLEAAIGDPDGLRSIGVWLNQHNQPKWGDRLVLIAAAAERGADRR